MKLYNRELNEISNEKFETIINELNLKVINYLCTNYNIDRSLLEKRIYELSVILYSRDNDSTIYKKIDGKLKEFIINKDIFGLSPLAMSGDIEQTHEKNICHLKNGIFVDPSYTNNEFAHQYIHELCHHLSKNNLLIFDKNNETIYKSGLELQKLDINDNSIEIINKGLNEGITENIALNITGDEPNSYYLTVLLSQLLMIDKKVVEVYFSNDNNKIKEFLDNFEKTQPYATREHINEILSRGGYYPIDINLLKGLIAYTINSCITFDELNEKRQLLIPLLKKFDQEVDLNIMFIQNDERIEVDIKNIYNEIIRLKKMDFEYDINWESIKQKYDYDNLDIKKQSIIKIEYYKSKNDMSFIHHRKTDNIQKR